MARPRKNNADYFSHDNDMRNDRKIKALRERFGLIGYAVWNMFLEVLTDSDYFRVEIDKIELELLSGDFGIKADKLQEVLDYLVTLDLIQRKDKSFCCRNLEKRLKPLVEKRNIMKQKYNKKKITEAETSRNPRKDSKKGVPEADTKVSGAETPQSKVKKSKVKKSKRIDKLSSFENAKMIIAAETQEKYNDKNCYAAIDDFIEYCNYSKNAKYKDYKLAFQKWVREDRFDKYGDKSKAKKQKPESKVEAFKKINPADYN